MYSVLFSALYTALYAKWGARTHARHASVLEALAALAPALRRGRRRGGQVGGVARVERRPHIAEARLRVQGKNTIGRVRLGEVRPLLQQNVGCYLFSFVFFCKSYSKKQCFLRVRSSV